MAVNAYSGVGITTLGGHKNVFFASIGRSKIATAYQSHSAEKKSKQKVTTYGQKD